MEKHLKDFRLINLSKLSTKKGVVPLALFETTGVTLGFFLDVCLVSLARWVKSKRREVIEEYVKQCSVVWYWSSS